MYLTVIDITMGGLQMLWLWKDSDYLAVLSFAPPFILGLVRRAPLAPPCECTLVYHVCTWLTRRASSPDQVGGTLLLLFTPIDDVWLKRAIGAMLLSMGAYRLYRKRLEDKKAASRLAGVSPSPYGYGAHHDADPTRPERLSPQMSPTRQRGESRAAGAAAPRREGWIGGHCGLDFTSWHVQGMVWLCSGTAGLFGGVFGIGGPPLMLFVAYYESSLNFPSWRGVSANLRIIGALARAVILVWRHLFDFGRPGVALRYIIMVAAAASGLGSGNVLARYVDRAFVPWAIIAILLYSSFIMAVSGSDAGEDAAMIIIPTTAAAGVAAYLATKYGWWRVLGCPCCGDDGVDAKRALQPTTGTGKARDSAEQARAGVADSKRKAGGKTPLLTDRAV